MAGHREDVTELPGMEAPELGPTGRPASFFPEPAALKRHGPARIIALCNQKGGVGKTTTSINLGATLAEYGRRVLAVDFDPQGALSAGLGVPTHDVPTIYDLLLGSSTAVVDTIVPTSTPGLDVIPANIDLSAAEVHLVNEVAREQILARVLRQVCSSRRSRRCATGSTRRSSSTAFSRRCTTLARCTPARCCNASSRRSGRRCSRRSSAAA
jgi:chromosome partitioning protein